MDIAAFSMNLKQAQFMQQISLAVTEQTMELQDQTSQQLVEMLDAPHLTAGHTIYISV